MPTPESCHAAARECRNQAATIDNPGTRRVYESLADVWTEIATSAERFERSGAAKSLPN